MLGFFERRLDGLHRGVNVYDRTTLEALGVRDIQVIGHAQSSHAQFTVGQHLGHHHHDFGCADIERHHEVFVVLGHVYFLEGARTGEAVADTSAKRTA